MYRIIACDLDETLLDDTGSVPPRVRTAVADARERGARFVLATGRPFLSVHRTLDELGLLGRAGEYVISFNGGVITENVDERPLTSCSLARETAEALYEQGVEPEETMAIGDNSNDVPMLRTAGLGVAVANASDEAKAAADYVCTLDNTAGGVAEALEKFVLDA